MPLVHRQLNMLKLVTVSREPTLSTKNHIKYTYITHLSSPTGYIK